MMMTFAVCW